MQLAERRLFDCLHSILIFLCRILPFKLVIIVIQLMFLGINMFLALLKLILTLAALGLKWVWVGPKTYLWGENTRTRWYHLFWWSRFSNVLHLCKRHGHTQTISTTRAVARALIRGGGGGVFIYSCSARLISFEINLKTTDFKRNSSGITRIYEYTPPPPPQLTL